MDCNFCDGLLGDSLARKISSELGVLCGNGACLLGHVGGEGAASAIVGLATTMAILFLPKLDWKPLVWVGTVSYSLYLLHVPIGGRVLNVLERFSHFELVKILAVPAALATSLLAAWLFFLLIEKPSHEAARKITKNLKSEGSGINY